MPFYEYQCNSCGHTLEAMQKVSDAPLKKCPHCGKPQLQRLMSAPVFRLKGGGWYETDFKSDQDNKRNLADRPDAEAPKEEKKGAAETAAKERRGAPMRRSRRKRPPISRPKRPAPVGRLDAKTAPARGDPRKSSAAQASGAVKRPAAQRGPAKSKRQPRSKRRDAGRLASGLADARPKP